MNNKERKLRKLIREYVRREMASNHAQPVRSPFSHNSSYYNGGRPYNDTFQEITQLYNTTYRSRHLEEAFESVHYSEPLNILVAFPLEESEFEAPFVTLGLKAARGYGKDYRFIDKSIPGAGSYYVTEEEANDFLVNTKKALRELSSDYAGLLGDVEPQRIEESVNEKAVSKAQQRFFGMVYSYKQDDLDTSDLPDNLVDRIKQAADNISMSDAKEYADTDTEGLPQRAENKIREHVKRYILDNITPPNSKKLVERLKQEHPKTFGGSNPKKNPCRFAWALYHKRNLTN